jgi:hypothetical protein
MGQLFLGDEGEDFVEQELVSVRIFGGNMN